MTGTPRPEPVFTKQQRIAELARNCPDMAFTNLAHHIDIEWMLTAHARTRKDGAVGVDGQTAAEYEVNLEANLQNLLDRAKSGTYVAPPVRRVHIPKAGSATETRPLGIPAHIPIKEQHQKLTQKLRGHFGYYGIIGNYLSLQKYREGARRIWRRKLSRRRRAGDVTWAQFLRLEQRYNLPRARVVHGLRSSVAKS